MGEELLEKKHMNGREIIEIELIILAYRFSKLTKVLFSVFSPKKLSVLYSIVSFLFLFFSFIHLFRFIVCHFLILTADTVLVGKITE